MPPSSKDAVVLVAGGGVYQPPAEILTLGAPPSFAATKGPMRTDRHAQTANLITTGIHKGEVLIAGGNSDSGTSGAAIGSAERYNPASGTFLCVGGPSASSAGSGPCTKRMISARIFYKATNLEDGTILFTGGVDENDNVLNSAELYNPTADSFIRTRGRLSGGYFSHTATLIDTGSSGSDNGMVLVAGGFNSIGIPQSAAELYDPAKGTFTPTTSKMMTPRALQTATFLAPDVVSALRGQILITGGYSQNSFGVLRPQNTTELFNPATNKFTALPNSMKEARANHSAILLRSGKVLILGGSGFPSPALADAEIFDPMTKTFTPTNSVPCPAATPNVTSPPGCMLDTAYGQTPILLSNGQVIVTGGFTHVRAVELFDPTSKKFSALAATPLGGRRGLKVDQDGYTATMLADGSHVLVAGGVAWGAIQQSAELFDATHGAVAGIGLMLSSFAAATATTLPDKRILFTGGSAGEKLGSATNSAQLFDYSTTSFLCPDGSRPAPNSFLPPCSSRLHDARWFHTATMLPRGADAGQVLIAGGDIGEPESPTAELFNPADAAFTCINGAGTFLCNKSMTDVRFSHTATFLTTGSDRGKVLIAGGSNSSEGTLATAELFDPSTQTFSCVGGVSANPPKCKPALNGVRTSHYAFLLRTGPNVGDVLIAGGSDQNGVPLRTAELFDPDTGSFSCVGGKSASVCKNSMVAGRVGSSATMLANGRILFAGGINGGTASGYSTIATAEIYDPVSNTFSATAGHMTIARAGHSAALLNNGDVLIIGGATGRVGGGTTPRSLLISLDGDIQGSMVDAGEIFRPSIGTFSPTGSLTEGRGLASTVVVQVGSIGPAILP
ncbi:MAG: hypothetical protein JOZ29_19280 [Deltaproteobacteria bacterium]|nr:hypothetical protein [Deltaproteobacteria bacterium]